MDAKTQFGYNEYLHFKKLDELDICSIQTNNFLQSDFHLESLIIPYFTSPLQEYNFFDKVEVNAGYELRDELLYHLEKQHIFDLDGLAVTCSPYGLNDSADRVRLMKILPMNPSLLTLESLTESLTNAFKDVSFIYPGGKAAVPLFGTSLFHIDDIAEAYKQALIQASGHLHRLESLEIFLAPEEDSIVISVLKTIIPPYFWKK